MKVTLIRATERPVDLICEAEMKELSVLAEENGGALMPFTSVKRVRIHLCGECFHGLRLIAEDVIRQESAECAKS